jgi:hypothetical protein
MSAQGQKLFDLLPALYRLKDAGLNFLSPSDLAELQTLQNKQPPLDAVDQLRLTQLSRGPLQSLLMLIEEQFAVIAEDLEQLYDDQFIETCASWVIPYIGDLIGYQLVNGVAPAVASPRAEVANTISMRRRKGSVLVLEQLARDVTGWGAHAVEYFKVLAATQYMKHTRPHNYYAPNVRGWQTAGYMDTAFDRTAHTVDTHRIAAERGRCNIQNIGIFLWSLTPYSLTAAPLTAVDGSGQFFRFSPLGADMCLFNHPVSQGSEISTAAQPVNVAARLPRRVLCQDIQSGVGAAYYGEGKSLALYFNNALLNPYQIQVSNLSGADGSWANVPTAGSPYTVGVDPELGRLALAVPLNPAPKAGSVTQQLQASFYYGFSCDMGGGEYSRSDNFTVPAESLPLPFPDNASTPRYSTLQEALTFAAANLDGNGQIAVEIADSGVYALTGLQVNVPAGSTIELRGADGRRPALILGGEISVTGAAHSVFSLNGLLLAYGPASGATVPAALLHVPSGGTNALSQLKVTDCTIVPGWALTSSGAPQSAYAGLPTVLAESSGLQVVITNSIVGGLRVDPEVSASLSGSIVDACNPTGVAYANTDGTSGGGSLTVQYCTVIGKIHATLFAMVSDSIVWAGLAVGDKWAAPVLADRKQQGCVRFTYLPPGPVVPRQFECIEHAQGVPQPLFYSLRYGDPGYGKLWPSTDDSIREGAENGGEMGAFNSVLAALREADLRARLQEYLPAGLEFGIFYEN